MFWRILALVFWQLVPALVVWRIGFWQGHWLPVALAALLGGYVWIILDMLRGLRVMRWLRAGEVTQPPTGRGIWMEVAERARKLVRNQQRLAAESENRLQEFLAAIQASPNGVVLLDAEGRIEWFNLTAAAHFGLDVRRDLQQHFGNLVRDPAFAAYFSTKDFQHEVQMPGRGDSHAKPVTLSVQLHLYGEGRGMLLSRDITAVEQAEAMRRDFVANVSHEIRTPLTVLAGFVETLQSIPLEAEECNRYLALMGQQAQRMQTLVSDLLTLSRLEGSPPPPAHDWVGAGLLMAQCEQDAKDLSSVLWGTSEGIRFDYDRGYEIAGSSTELHSAMSNLIGNAIRYSPKRQPIEVTLKVTPNGGLRFSVRDEGQGIAPEHLPRLTERFYRVDRSRSRETGGTGLGLAIVKHVVQRHGASLEIESTEGKGSRFTIIFPAQRVRTCPVDDGLDDDQDQSALRVD